MMSEKNTLYKNYKIAVLKSYIKEEKSILPILLIGLYRVIYYIKYYFGDEFQYIFAIYCTRALVNG